jgi:hypothetical protein
MVLAAKYPKKEVADITAYRSCALLLILSILLQKFALPGMGGAISMAIVPLLLVTAFLALRGTLHVCDSTFLLYMLFLASTAVSTGISSSPRLSVHSWMLLLVVQVPLVFMIPRSQTYFERLVALTSTLGVLFALAGLGQLAVQAAIGSDIAFWLDYNIPDSVALAGFNNLNPLFWSATTFKSNGIFFKEPASFCQFLALSFLAELLLAGRLYRLIIIGAGMVTSYSGTGLITLAVFLPFYLLRGQQWKTALALFAFVLVLAAAGERLQLEAITSRSDEFTSAGTSGHARFVTPLALLAEVLTSDLKTFLLGRGSGTVTEFFTARAYDMFDPTYAKLLYEYGVVGFAAYGAFLYFAALRHRGALRWPLTFTYLFLGGYLQDPALVTPLAVLGAWSGRYASRNGQFRQYVETKPAFKPS